MVATRMPWGKYRGEEIRDVPAGYLCWALEEATLTTALHTAIQAELTRRFAPSAPPPPPSASATNGTIPAALRPLAQKIVKAGFRRLARDHHPDHGGTDDTMRLLLEASRVLTGLLRQSPAENDEADVR
jgi:hypothetical protein